MVSVLAENKDRYSLLLTAIPASVLLKKNTDSVRGAVDNDMFGTLPDLTKLNALDRGWPDEL